MAAGDRIVRSTGAPEGAAEHNGNGTIYSNAVGYDTPIAALRPDQPGNCAVIALDSRPGIQLPVPPARHRARQGRDRLQGQAHLRGGARERTEGSRRAGHLVMTRPAELLKRGHR